MGLVAETCDRFEFKWHILSSLLLKQVTCLSVSHQEVGQVMGVVSQLLSCDSECVVYVLGWTNHNFLNHFCFHSTIKVYILLFQQHNTFSFHKLPCKQDMYLACSP